MVHEEEEIAEGLVVRVTGAEPFGHVRGAEYRKG